MNRKHVLAIGLVAALALVGCGRSNDDFRDGLPRPETVRLDVPGDEGAARQGLSSTSLSLEGETSEMYRLTRATTVNINGGTLFVLNLVKAITEHKPTSINGDTATWGPHTDALSPNTWRLVVKRIAEGQYQYSLEGRAKTESDSDFRAVLYGTHKVALDANGNAMEGFGSGEFTLDWDVAQTLPEHDANVGVAVITYSRVSPSAEATIDVVFTQVWNEEKTARNNGKYHYQQAPGEGGEFEFQCIGNVHKELDKPAAENLTIKSRWMHTGAGRSDVKVSGGDVSGETTLNECWDTNFKSTFFHFSDAPIFDYGIEISACVFASAEYSSF
jgi:hypothetical protein